MPDDPMPRRLLRALVPSPVRARYWAHHAQSRCRRMRRGTLYEPELCRQLDAAIQPGWTCLDIGANRGIIAAAMAERVGPAGRVICFEPHPENIRHLRMNLTACGLIERVRVVEAAVGDGSTDRLTLYAGRRSSHSEWNVMGQDVDGHATPADRTVRAVSLDECLGSAIRVDLVKIDVEGAERFVLAGMRGVLERWAPLLIIEVHDAVNLEACHRLLGERYTLEDMAGRALSESDPMPGRHIVARPRAAVAAQAA